MCLNGRELENWKKKTTLQELHFVLWVFEQLWICFGGGFIHCGFLFLPPPLVGHCGAQVRSTPGLCPCLCVFVGLFARLSVCVCVCVCVSPFVSPLTDPQDGASHLRVSVLFCFLFSTVSFSLVGPNASDLMDFADPITSRRIMSSSTVIKEFFFASFSTTFLFIIRRGRFFFFFFFQRKEAEEKDSKGDWSRATSPMDGNRKNHPESIIRESSMTCSERRPNAITTLWMKKEKKSESKRSHSRTIYFRLCFSLVRFWWKKKERKRKKKKRASKDGASNHRRRASFFTQPRLRSSKFAFYHLDSVDSQANRRTNKSEKDTLSRGIRVVVKKNKKKHVFNK